METSAAPSNSMPRRIEVEDLRPGDTFEYESKEWGHLYSGPGRYEGRVLDADGRWIKGLRSWVNRDTVRGRVGRNEIRVGVYDPVAPNTKWWDLQAEEPVKRDDMTYVATVVGQNNHGYVVLPPRTVVVLIERAEAQ